LAVYTFVLESEHVMIINGIECITLGKTFDEKVKHDYFGTEAVVNDLMKLEGWNYGEIVLNDNDMKRGGEANRVDGITSALKLVEWNWKFKWMINKTIYYQNLIY